MAGYWIRDKLTSSNLEHANQKDFDGLTPLIRAANIGDINQVETLLKIANIDVNKTDDHNRTAIQVASQCGFIRIVELLLGIDGINIDGARKFASDPEIKELLRKSRTRSVVVSESGPVVNDITQTSPKLSPQIGRGQWIYNSSFVKTIDDIFVKFESEFNKSKNVNIDEVFTTPHKAFNRIFVIDDLFDKGKQISELFSDIIEMVSMLTNLVRELYSEYNFIRATCNIVESSNFCLIIEEIEHELKRCLLLKQKLLVTECEHNGFILGKDEIEYDEICADCVKKYSHTDISSLLRIKKQLKQLSETACHVCMCTPLDDCTGRLIQNNNFENRQPVCPFSVTIASQKWSFPYICNEDFVISELKHIMQCHEFSDETCSNSKRIRFECFDPHNHPTCTEKGLNLDSYLLISHDYWMICHYTTWKLRQREERCFGNIHVKSLYSIAEKIMYRGKSVNDVLRTTVSLDKFENIKKVTERLGMKRIDQKANDHTSLSQTKNRISKCTYVFSVQYNDQYYPMWLEIQFVDKTTTDGNIIKQQRMEHIKYELTRLKRSRTRADFESIGLEMKPSDLLVDVGDERDDIIFSRLLFGETCAQASILPILDKVKGSSKLKFV